MHKQLTQLLQSISTIPESELAKVQEIFRPVQLAKGDFFARAGERPQTLGFVTSGLLRLYYIDPDGDEFSKSFCDENSFVAAYSALLTGVPSRIFIEALEDSTLLVANYDAYQALSEGHLCWQIVNRKIAETLFIKKELRESELLLDDAQTRYLRFQAEYPGLDGRLKKYQIASYLGITPVSLSRIRTQLKKDDGLDEKINIG